MVGTTLEPKTYKTPKGVHITGLYKDTYAKILTPEALAFIAQLRSGIPARAKRRGKR